MLNGIDASEYDGVILTHGDTKVSFLVAPVEYPSIVEVKSLNAVAVMATPKKFAVNSYIVAIPKSDLLAYSNNYCDPNERALVTVTQVHYNSLTCNTTTLCYNTHIFIVS